MSEIHPAVEAKSVKARRDTQLDKMALAVALAEKKIRRAVAKDFLIRGAVAILLVVGLIVAEHFDLISYYLAFPIECVAVVWFAIWLGAWLQYRFGKEGLLK